MKNPKFGPIILAVILSIILLCLPSHELSTLITQKTVSQTVTALNPTIFQGVAIQKKIMQDKKFIPIYGSSELSRFDEFHPSIYFKNHNSQYTPYLIGRGGTQSLIHFLSLSSVQPYLKGKKIIYVLSPTWFKEEGLDEGRFDPNFSKLQAIQFALNQQIPIELKRKAVQRMLDYSMVKNDAMLSTILKESISTKTKNTMKQKLLNDLVTSYLSVAKKQDVLTSLIHPSIYSTNSIKPLPKNMSFEDMLKKADELGKETANNNRFGIKNSVYSFHFANHLQELKNSKADISYDKSPEYGDLQLVLDLLKASGAKPLFISLPVNGYFYDYTGFNKTQRKDYYDKVRNQIEKSGFPVADLTGHEYDKYFFEDSIHIRLKGWIYTDQAIEKFMNEK
jgi:D-alanine transfer protein